MGEAKRRGTYEERKAMAIKARKVNGFKAALFAFIAAVVSSF